MDIPQQVTQVSHKGSSFIVISVTIAVVITGSILYWYSYQDQEFSAQFSVIQTSQIKQEPVLMPKIERFGNEIFKKLENQSLDNFLE